MNILSGKGSLAQRNAVYANAGLAVSTYMNVGLKDSVEIARKALDSGKALFILEQLVKGQNG